LKIFSKSKLKFDCEVIWTGDEEELVTLLFEILLYDDDCRKKAIDVSNILDETKVLLLEEYRAIEFVDVLKKLLLKVLLSES